MKSPLEQFASWLKHTDNQKIKVTKSKDVIVFQIKN